MKKKHQKARSKKICYRISCKGKRRPEGGAGKKISTKSVESTNLLAVGSAGAGRPAGTLCVSTARHDDDDDDDDRTSINEEEMSRSD